MSTLVQYGFYLFVLVVLAIPLGKYIAKVMDNEKVWLSKMIEPLEKFIYKLLRIDKEEQMNWKQYLKAVLLFSLFGFIFLFILNLVQGMLGLNPEKVAGTSWHLAFNTTASFVSNTNWQAYSGEATLSYLTQMLGLTVQNFMSAATGLAVLYALIRSFVKVKAKGLGSFWVDIVKATLYILMPLSIVLSIGLVTQGVVQNFHSYESTALVEPIVLEDGSVVKEQVVPMGPAASQIAIKQLGTNGGGFFGVNSAHPLENPTILSNLLEMLSLLLIPAALCFSFGRSIKDKRQGKAMFITMFILLVVALGSIAVSESYGTKQLAQHGEVAMQAEYDYPGGNMEGKEARFGIASSSTWAAFTTAASNGSVNSMHDSYTPLGSMVMMLLMQLGEVIFGGVGSGLYGLIAFAIVAVFIAGLMVGRTPEYLGKKIEPYEMKWAMLACLATPLAILIGTGIASMVPEVVDSLN
ncbi:MAG: potassium-transporting ATPase subunit A, partial [Erysipelotrichia bacterium]|nr:potassium-transporting ATPase subunit A [Erysipelotrichia bacterium]